MIDWKRKLTSRKLWVAIASFVSMLIVALRGDNETAETVSALIMAGATVIAYVFAEGFTDAANVDGGAPEEVDQAETAQDETDETRKIGF